ncbi:autotransporter outer membrane beta-barrel domain-containing protein [Photobacterium phosphoreum]|uniref:autotransporter family protein n=1 Tax=Photobacterium phosphoreum TaxID=659 RepID=UPI001E532B39|nr:autotransporter outer membrane beta-barrel domain-containing protein [Photobacterium phosphoreum]MCD9505477.1 autotransporter domain-containing protein [Photobacterium phosphoreum]
MKNYKRTTLSIIVASLFTPMAYAACDSTIMNCETVVMVDTNNYGGKEINTVTGHGISYEGGEIVKKHLYLKHNITANSDGANAIHVNKGVTLNNSNLNIGDDNAGPVNVISHNGTGIMVEGNIISNDASNPNTGIYIKNGSVVSGKVNAIDFSKSTTSMRIDIDGTINGNIIGNNAQGNKINLANGKQDIAVFNGDQILGIGKIDNLGKLTIITRDDKSIIFGSNFSNTKNSSINFQISGNNTLNHALLYVDGTTTFQEGAKVNFTYKGENINDLIGKEIVLVHAKEGIVGGQYISVTGGTQTLDFSPLLAATDSWLEEEPPIVNGGVLGDKLIATYDVNYAGGDNFVNNAVQGGVTEQEKAVGQYVVDYALVEHNKTKSETSAKLLSLLTSAGSSAAATAAVVAEITPDAEGAEVHAALQAADKIRSTANTRTAYLRNASREGYAIEGWNVSSGLIYGYGSEASSDGVNGYIMNTYGIGLGIDRLIDNNKMFGLSLSYIDSSTDIKNTENTKIISGIHLLGYTGWFDDNIFVDANFNLGVNKVNSERKIGISTGYEGASSSKMDYDMLQLGYQLTAGYTFNTKYMNIEPRVSYQHQWVRVDDRQESGSIVDMQYDRQSYSTSQLGAGISIYKTYDISYGKFTPTTSVMAYYDTNKNDRVTDTFGLVMDKGSNPLANRQTVTGAHVGGDIIEAKFNANLTMDHGLTLDGSVSYYQRNLYDEGILGLNISKQF